MESAGKKILVIRFSSLGDLILLLPLLDTLKEGFPDSSIDLVTKEKYREIFIGNRNLNSIYTLEKGSILSLIRLRKIIASNKYDIIIDAHNVIRSNIIYYSVKAGYKVRIKKDQLKKYMLIKHKKNLYGEIKTQTGRYLELAERLGIKTSGTVSDYELPEKSREKARSLMNSAGLKEGRIVAVAPGARWEAKRWPVENFCALAFEISSAGFDLLIVGGPEEENLGRRVEKASTGAKLNAVGDMSVPETAAVLESSSLLVTNDSALLHLSESVGTPVIALFGPTVREFGYYPRLEESVSLEVDLECRPCSRNGARPCPLGTRECLRSIDAESVMQRVKSFMEKASVKSEARNGAP